MPEKCQPGYRNIGRFGGNKRSHTGELCSELVRGDRVRIVIRNRPSMYGTYAARVGNTVYVKRRGKVEMHHWSHVTFYPTRMTLMERAAEVRSGWSPKEFWFRAPHAVLHFSWPTFSDSFAGGF